MSLVKASGVHVAGRSTAEAKHVLFEQLIRPHFERMYRLAFRLTRSVADAEDLVQDVLVSLYQRCDELSAVADLRTWLARVVYNRFVDQRRSFIRRRILSPLRRPSGSRDEETELQTVPDEALGPDEAAGLSTCLGQLDAALSRLPEEQRTAVLLHDAEGYSLEEIHEVTGVPIGTVKSRLHRGRARLRMLLGQGTFFA